MIKYNVVHIGIFCRLPIVSNYFYEIFMMHKGTCPRFLGVLLMKKTAQKRIQ